MSVRYPEIGQTVRLIFVNPGRVVYAVFLGRVPTNAGGLACQFQVDDGTVFDDTECWWEMPEKNTIHQEPPNSTAAVARMLEQNTFIPVRKK